MHNIAKKHLEWTKYELKQNNFDETDFGKSFLKFLEESHAIAKSEPMIMNSILELVTRTFKHQPHTALLGEGEMVTQMNTHGQQSIRNKRYPSVCFENGKYYDDTAITFIDSNGVKYHMSQNGKISRQEIKFPYYPVETLVKI